MMRRIMTIISLCFCLCLSTALVGMAEEARVHDDAGLLGSDIVSLEAQIQKFRDISGMDMVIVTTEDTGGKSASQYAEDLYIDKNFGTGKEYSGVMFLIDMQNRELVVKPVGAMTRFLTDSRIESVLDDVYVGAQEGDFTAAAEAFISDATSYYKKGIPGGQYNYDKETGAISRYHSIRWYEALIALGVSLFAAAVPCLNIRLEYAMKQQRDQAGNYLMAYRGVSQFAYANHVDDLLDKHVAQRIIVTTPPRSGGGMGGGSSAGRSTVHTSSGRTFGGGSRKF